jgi:hypothetical protein
MGAYLNTQVFKRLMCVVVYCLWAVWWYFVCDAAVITVTGPWAEWPDLWFLARTEIFLCEVCFLWWWPWRLLSCTVVTPCSLVMCEYSLPFFIVSVSTAALSHSKSAYGPSCGSCSAHGSIQRPSVTLWRKRSTRVVSLHHNTETEFVTYSLLS